MGENGWPRPPPHSSDRGWDMYFTLTAYDKQGRRLADLGTFGNVASARQAMLDHAHVADLPAEEPWFGPDVRVAEGWFVGQTEYCICF